MNLNCKKVSHGIYKIRKRRICIQKVDTSKDPFKLTFVKKNACDQVSLC